jgi:hypothetical protein
MIAIVFIVVRTLKPIRHPFHVNSTEETPLYIIYICLFDMKDRTNPPVGW